MPFNLFSKNKPSRPPEESFTLFQLNNNGKQYLLRFNTALKDHPLQKQYPFQVGIAIPLKNTSNGFPTKEENISLLDIEEECIQKLGAKNRSIFVGTITGGNMKEFVFYTNTPEELKSSFEEIQIKVKEFELQLMIQKDEEWKVYKTYCPTR